MNVCMKWGHFLFLFHFILWGQIKKGEEKGLRRSPLYHVPDVSPWPCSYQVSEGDSFWGSVSWWLMKLLLQVQGQWSSGDLNTYIFWFSYTDTGSHGSFCWWVLLWKVVFSVFTCVFNFGDRNLTCSLTSLIWEELFFFFFFFQFGFLLIRMECWLQSSLHVRLELNTYLCFIYFVACVNIFFLLPSSNPVYERVICSVLSYSLWHPGLQPTRLLPPWDFQCKDTGVGCHFLLQVIFLTQRLNLGLLLCRQILYPLSHPSSICVCHNLLYSFTSWGTFEVFPSRFLLNKAAVNIDV